MNPKLTTEEIIEKFSNTKKKQYLITIPLILGILILINYSEEGTGTILGISTSTLVPIGILLMISGFVFSLINWRCPSCKKYLGKAINPKFCINCGTQLKKEDTFK